MGLSGLCGFVGSCEFTGSVIININLVLLEAQDTLCHNFDLITSSLVNLCVTWAQLMLLSIIWNLSHLTGLSIAPARTVKAGCQPV